MHSEDHAGERRRGRRAAARAVLAVVVVALALSGCGEGLPDDASGLPYRIEKHGAPITGFMSIEAADLDGDGIEEFVTFSRAPNDAYYYLALRRQVGETIQVADQRNNDEAWLYEHAGMLEIDGDPFPEILTSTHYGDSWAELGFVDVLVDSTSLVADSLAGATPVLFELAEKRLARGVWDGRFIAADASDEDGDGWRETITFAVKTGLARYPRGVGRANARTGELLWFTPFAGIVTRHVLAEDFDSDGENEYVAVFTAPGNRVRVGDMTDSEVWVAAIDGDGTVMWRHQTGAPSGGGWPYSVDLNADERLEVLSWESYSVSSRPDTARLRLWDGETGELLSCYSNTGWINGVEPGGAAAPRSVYLGGEDGFVRRITWDGEKLVNDRSFDCGEVVHGVGVLTVDPIPDPVVVVLTAEGAVCALDLELSLLSVFRVDEVHDRLAPILPVTFADGTRGASVGIGPKSGLMMLEFSRSPVSTWIVVLVPIGLLVLFCAAVPSIRRRVLRLLRRALIPRADREKALDELLGALVRAGHGKLAATTTLRRLTKQLTMLGGLESEPPGQFIERYREALTDVREIGMPGIEAIHREAARIGLKASLVSTLRRRLTSTRSLLRGIPARPPAAAESARLADLLDAGTASLDDALNGVLDGCRLELSSNLMNEIRRAAGARRVDFLEIGAELTVPTISKAETVRVLGTRGEVSFVIENLLGNSLAAVERSDEQRVEVTVEQEDREAVMLVSDTGTGIPPDMHERIFDDGVTGTHGGSGHGLAESRRILAKRGGSIAVARSEPGQGTTFEVRFQIVDGGVS